MRSCSAAVFAAILAAALPAIPARGGDAASPCHEIIGDRIIIHGGEKPRTVQLGGIVDRVVGGGDRLYCIVRRDENGTQSLSLAQVDSAAAEKGPETRLPIDPAVTNIARLAAVKGAVFLLALPAASPGAGSLYRLDLNDLSLARTDGVMDFTLARGAPVLLGEEGGGLVLRAGETGVALSLKCAAENRPVIREIVDDRMVFVGACGETELIDIVAGTSLYQYAAERMFILPDGYNLDIRAADETASDPDDRSMVFYRVLIDGVEAGRTDAGPSTLPREFRAMVVPDRCHLVRLERWVLNRSRGRYERANNIDQPKVQRIYMPGNRIVQLSVTRRGSEYIYQTAPAYR